VICLKWAPDSEGAQIGSADLLLEEWGLIVRGVRITLAVDKNFPEVIAFPEPVSVPAAADRFVFFAHVLRAVEEYLARQAAQALAACAPITGTWQ
jgi:hypothetical protein